MCNEPAHRILTAQQLDLVRSLKERTDRLYELAIGTEPHGKFGDYACDLLGDLVEIVSGATQVRRWQVVAVALAQELTSAIQKSELPPSAAVIVQADTPPEIRPTPPHLVN